MRFLILATSVLLANTAWAEPRVLWEIDGFKMPESAVLDTQRSQIYVSNVNLEPMKEDGNGSIGLISKDGKHHQVEWVKGMSSPKGLALRGKYLFVADVKELVVVNVEDGCVSARYPVPGAGVLNGLAFAPDGSLYISDWIGNRIYRLQKNDLSVWLESTDLESPNGLVVRDDYLYVAAWGKNPGADFSTESSGMLKRISLKDKSIESFRSESTWMNLDGLHPVPNGWLATDFIRGELLSFNTRGEIRRRYKLGQTSADFWLEEKENLLLVPYLMGNRVTAYRLNHE